jgi:uncharacterized membrane protein YciS (DUF1049 family)
MDFVAGYVVGVVVTGLAWLLWILIDHRLQRRLKPW